MDNLDRIDYKNVYYKCYTFPFRRMPEALEAFKQEFAACGLHENGMFFYSLDGIERISETEANETVTFYQPAVENSAPEGCTLQHVDSFLYSHMSYRVIREDHEKNAEAAYYDLTMEAERNGKRIVSPIFNEFLFDEDENGKKVPCCVVKAQIG